MNRSSQQNKALHKWFRQMSVALNSAGFDIKKTMKDDFEIDWSEESVKTLIFNEVSKVMFDKTSSELDSDELPQVFNVVTRHLSKTTGVYVPFPSNEG